MVSLFHSRPELVFVRVCSFCLLVCLLVFSVEVFVGVVCFLLGQNVFVPTYLI